MASNQAFEIELLHETNVAHRESLECLLANSPDLLSEHKMLELSSPAPTRHLAVRSADEFVAAAIVARHGQVWNVELVSLASQEHARMVAFDAAMVELDGELVQLWEPSGGLSVELAEAISRYDLEETRTLLHLTRDLSLNPPQPGELATRSFSAERDATEWIAVNNLAFAQHKEQGSWTVSTLQERMAQPWFDEHLFLLAGHKTISAWCWCKIDPAGDEERGEIYVIGTSPSAQGQGFARAMLELGCAEMARRGVAFVDLYVDGDNAPALALYGRSGFVETSRRRSWLFT